MRRRRISLLVLFPMEMKLIKSQDPSVEKPEGDMGQVHLCPQSRQTGLKMVHLELFN